MWHLLLKHAWFSSRQNWLAINCFSTLLTPAATANPKASTWNSEALLQNPPYSEYGPGSDCPESRSLLVVFPYRGLWAEACFPCLGHGFITEFISGMKQHLPKQSCENNLALFHTQLQDAKCLEWTSVSFSAWRFLGILHLIWGEQGAVSAATRVLVAQPWLTGL